MERRFVLAYDAQCGPCSRFKRIVELLDAEGNIEFTSLEAADQSGLLASVAPSSKYSSFHLIRLAYGADAGEAWSGSLALLPLMRLLSTWGATASRVLDAVPSGVVIGFAYSTLSKMHRTCPARTSDPPSATSSAVSGALGVSR